MFKKNKKIVFFILFTLLFTLIHPLAPKALASTDGTDAIMETFATYEEWDRNKVYYGGDMVTYKGVTYRAQWWTQGEEPGVAEVWRRVSEEDGEIQPWDRNKVYYGGDQVSHNGKIYKAQWWTQGEEPGIAAVWLLIGSEPNPNPTPTPTPTPTPNPDPTKFKVVGYYPSWQPGNTHKIQYNNLTHINYAFAIPTSDGDLLPLENPDLARQIINDAHANGVKVLLAVGGWSYNGVPLESTFMSATNTPEKIVRFGNAIIAMAKQYGFDGVDMDWEHPRNDGTSKQQYTDLMVYLSNELHREGMLLTSAVLSGVTPEGIVYWDAAAHTDAVINAVDWFNVMAYDGGDGERHSGYDFAINSAKYWRDTRNMPAHKVVLGVPFYGRPSWATYEEILQANPNAYNTDVSMINGMQAHYNGIPTITAKTSWACDNIGGIMIWELSQDTTDLSKSLLNAIGNTVRNKGKW